LRITFIEMLLTRKSYIRSSAHARIRRSTQNISCFYYDTIL